MCRLAERIGIVTGASSGIGLAIANTLADEGAVITPSAAVESLKMEVPIITGSWASRVMLRIMPPWKVLSGRSVRKKA